MFSTTTEYALRALAALARMPQGRFALARELAAEAEVPSNYLSKILAQLVRSGVVRGTRGANGGYRLARPAERIRLLEVVEPFEGGRASPECLFGGGRECSEDRPCTAHESWRKVRLGYIEFLRRTSLAQVASGVAPAPRRARKRTKV